MFDNDLSSAHFSTVSSSSQAVFFLTRCQAMSSSTTFIHPARPILGRVFYVTLTKDEASALKESKRGCQTMNKKALMLIQLFVSCVQVELLQNGGTVTPPSEFFA